VFGLGYDDLSEALSGRLVWPTAALLLAAKFVATVVLPVPPLPLAMASLMRVRPIRFSIGFVPAWTIWRRRILLHHPTLSLTPPPTSAATLATALATLAPTAARAATLTAAARSHAFADRPLAERSGSISHGCHNFVLSFDFVFRG